MFKVIIWATDGSSAAEQALPYAKSLARADGARLIIVHADEFGAGRGGTHSVNASTRTQVPAAIRKHVEALKQ